MNGSGDSELLASQYSDEARSDVTLLHKSFAIQMEKLDAAHAEGIISDTEYEQWFEFFVTTKKEWLSLDLSKPENLLFLAVIAKHNMEIAKKLNFTRPPYTSR